MIGILSVEISQKRIKDPDLMFLACIRAIDVRIRTRFEAVRDLLPGVAGCFSGTVSKAVCPADTSVDGLRGFCEVSVGWGIG